MVSILGRAFLYYPYRLTGLLCGQVLVPEPVTATVHVSQADATVASNPGTSPSRGQDFQSLPLPPFASTSSAAAVVVEEAEELARDVVSFFQHSVEVVGSTVHHLQVVHALERLEAMPLNQVVDLELLKAAMHPTDSSHDIDKDYDEDASGSGVTRQLDAALDSVAEWQLRDVVDLGRLADALQDVQYSGPLDSRALQREGPRLRRAVHWEAVTESVRPLELRQALKALGSTHRGGSPFSELDIRAAVASVRMDAVRQVLSPSKPAQGPSRSLESSGMWTWEST
ncbi:hypothetical protein Vretimale_2320 [Volvox reticuliferus]|uniref:Uncharacterized protein n=1 Tax=Volvox reticuliferus TaxID=1737510 RepID=A0A8J4G2R3_9CHLO|nr:hypothetical protein Vretifemale_4608 [Volvox reticuliferus]GIL96523.1 hypothetical protein Vretimale_2320 [Volvox reticuliferus]